MNYFRIIIALTVFTLVACEKDIDIELPEGERKLVVEGSIEQNQPPFVILSKTEGYFDPVDLSALQSAFVHGATVFVSNGTNNIQLTEICTNQLPDSLLPTVAELIGVSLNSLKTFGFCLYTTLDPLIFGEIGKTYSLTIDVEGKQLTSTTTIPALVPMDSYWYKDQPGFNEYGYLWFQLTDPPALGNAYRMYTQRKGKDSRFIPAGGGSVFEDHFVNGLSFEGFIYRGHEINSTEEDDNNETSEYFLQGDTLIVKFCSIDQPHFKFWETFEVAAFNNGNPFAAPATIQTNIDGGLGIWGGVWCYL